LPPTPFFYDPDKKEIKYGDATLDVIVDENDQPIKLLEQNTLQDDNRNISLTVLDSPIVNQLKKWGFKIPSSSQKLERFFAVVEALNTIHTTTDHTKWGNKILKNRRWNIPIPNDPPVRKGKIILSGSTLGDWKNIKGGFLKIAKQAGILGELGEKAEPDTKKAKKKPAQRMEYDFTQFQGEWTDPQEYQRLLKEGKIQPNVVYEWQNTAGKFKDKGSSKAKTLYKALALLDLSPEEFLRASDDPNVGMQDKSNAEKLKWLTARLQERTFKAGGKQAKQFEHPMSLHEWTGMERPVPTIVDKMVKNQKSGKMELKPVSFSKERSKAYDPTGGAGQAGVMKQLTLVMRHFAESHGVSGAWGDLWSQKTPKAKKGSLNLDAEALEKFEKCLKKKPEFNEDGIYTFDEPDEEDIDEREFLDKAEKIENPNWKKPKLKTYDTTEEDWDDAYLYYRIGMDMGWRAEEAFTSVGNPPKNPDTDSGVINEGWKDKREDMILKNAYGYKGAYEREEMDAFFKKMEKDKIEKYTKLFDDAVQARVKAHDEITDLIASINAKKIMSEVIALTIVTRKTAHVRDIIHHGYIQNEETKNLIKDKRNKIAEGVKQKTQKEADKFGVQLKYVDNSVRIVAGRWDKSTSYGKEVVNNEHALIGYDGKYTKVGTMAYGADPKFSKPERDLFKEKEWQVPKVKMVQQNRAKLRAIFRVCYKEAMEEGQQLDNYFLKHSLHAIRHLFAQFWIKASNKDFTFVRDLGHWGGTDVLENFYGGAGGDETLDLQIKFGKKKFEDLIREEEVKKETKEEDDKTDNFLEKNTDGNTGGDEPPKLNEDGEPIEEEVVEIVEEDKK
jgi:hypothetical protein|tara:strand:+ start:3981 stop:6500 length:2520 start_codon:yes stop_codon:yes gene_type:complete